MVLQISEVHVQEVVPVVCNSAPKIRLEGATPNSASRLVYAMVFTALAVVTMFYLKPDSMFEESGRPRQFGLKPHQTLLSVGVATFLTAVFTLFVFTWIDAVFAV